MKRHQDDNGGHFWDHESTPNHCCKQLLVGWAWVQLQNSKRMATLPPNQTKMERRRNDGRQGETTRRRQGKQKKAQEMSFDVSWAIGKFFSSHFIFCY
jgi:hypothetical protein